jgi:hypothetical protein
MNIRSKRVIAEGDSWFDYPSWLFTGGGVVSHLERLAGIHILNLAKAGDESRFMLSLKQRRRLEEELKTADILLFSGGGNDLAGDQFCVWLNDNNDGDWSNAIDLERLDAALDFTMAIYDDLAQIRDEINPNCLIVTHGYDFPTPSDKGVLWFGPWLKPSLDLCGWRKPSDQFKIVKEVLTEFNRRLEIWDAKNHLHVQTQGFLSSCEWQNEIHPNRAGFQKIAQKFLESILSFQP